MYEDPIILSQRQISENIIKQTEDAIVSEVQHQLMIDIDKDELLRALQYDRDQYNQGYADGKAVGYELGYQKALEEMGVINDNNTTI